MAEYIEREAAYALSKTICDAIRNHEYHPATFGHLILDWIDDIPAADVQPVRHGRWVKTIGENGITSACRCNLCGFEDNRYSLLNYCPNCGAKMDKYGLSCPSKD